MIRAITVATLALSIAASAQGIWDDTDIVFADPVETPAKYDVLWISEPDANGEVVVTFDVPAGIIDRKGWLDKPAGYVRIHEYEEEDPFWWF